MHIIFVATVIFGLAAMLFLPSLANATQSAVCNLHVALVFENNQVVRSELCLIALVLPCAQWNMEYRWSNVHYSTQFFPESASYKINIDLRHLEMLCHRQKVNRFFNQDDVCHIAQHDMLIENKVSRSVEVTQPCDRYRKATNPLNHSRVKKLCLGWKLAHWTMHVTLKA